MSRRASAGLAGLITLLLVFQVVTGVSPVTALATAAVVGAQWWAGSWLWGSIRTRASEWETLGIGLALGTALSTFSGLVVSAAFGVPWGWAIVSLGVLVAALIRRRRLTTGLDASDFSQPGLIALGVGLLAGFASLAWSIRSYPLGNGDWSRYHADMGFFEALGHSLASWGPLASIFTPDSLIRYHWLVYAWSGQIQATTGGEPFTVITRVLPVVALFGALLVTIGWTRSLSRSRLAPSLAAGLLVTGGFVGAGYGTVLNFDSPSVAFTTMSLIGVLWTVGQLVGGSGDGRTSSRGQLVVLLVLTAMVSGGKVSSAAVAVGSVGVLWLASLRYRSLDSRNAALSLLTVVISSVVTFVVVAFGSADPGGLRLGDLLDRSSSVQGMNPVPGSLGILAGTLLLALAVLFRGAGVLWLLSNSASRATAGTWLGVGLLISSVGPILLISGGFNEVWFAVAAAGPLSALSAVGAVQAYRSVASAPWALSVVVVVFGSIAVSVGVVLAWSTGPSGGNVWTGTLRWAAPAVALVGSVIVGLALAFITRRPLPRHRAWFAWTVIVMVVVALPARALTLVGPLGTQPGMRSDLFRPSEPFVQTVDRATPNTDGKDFLDSAAWLRQESATRDLIVTNVSAWPTIPAITGRQTLAAGIRYQAPYGPASMIEPLLERERQSWDFIASPTAQTAAALCEHPVRWLVVDTASVDVANWEPWASEVFVSGSVKVLRWNSDQC